MKMTVNEPESAKQTTKRRDVKLVHSICCIALMVFMAASFISCNKTDRKASTVKKTTIAATVSKTSAKTQINTAKNTNMPTGTKQTETEVISEDEDDDKSVIDELIKEDDSESDSADIIEYSYDLGGRTIYITENANPGKTVTYPVRKVGADIFEYEYGADPVTDKIFDNARKTEQLLNCKLKVEGVHPSILANMRTILESEILAGVCKFSAIALQRGYYVSDWAKNNLIVPIDQYIDINNDVRYNQGTVIEEGSYKDRFYGIPWISLGWPAIWGMSYNMDMLSKEGLPDPVDLALADAWDWEHLTDILVTATRDFNGDGFTDQYGATSRGSFPTVQFVNMNGGKLIDSINGRFVYNLDNAKTLEALNYISDLHNVYKVISSTQTDYQNGKALMWLATITSPAIITSKNFTQRFIGIPRGPSNPSGKIVSSYGNWMWVIPVTEKDPRGIAILSTYLNRTLYDPNPIVSPIERRESVYTQIFGDDEKQKVYTRAASINIQFNNFDYYYYALGDFNTFINTLTTNIIKQSTSVTGYVMENKQKYQGIIDGLMN